MAAQCAQVSRNGAARAVRAQRRRLGATCFLRGGPRAALGHVRQASNGPFGKRRPPKLPPLALSPTGQPRLVLAISMDNSAGSPASAAHSSGVRGSEGSLRVCQVPGCQADLGAGFSWVSG